MAEGEGSKHILAYTKTLIFIEQHHQHNIDNAVYGLFAGIFFAKSGNKKSSIGIQRI